VCASSPSPHLLLAPLPVGHAGDTDQARRSSPASKSRPVPASRRGKADKRKRGSAAPASSTAEEEGERGRQRARRQATRLRFAARASAPPHLCRASGSAPPRLAGEEGPRLRIPRRGRVPAPSCLAGEEGPCCAPRLPGVWICARACLGDRRRRGRGKARWSPAVSEPRGRGIAGWDRPGRLG
jgi:hypothetical protein